MNMHGYLRKLLILFCAFIVSCSALPKKPSDAFEGFKFLSLPRECVPVGSSWSNEIGPIPSSCKNIKASVNRSVSNFSLSKEISSKINFSIYNFIRLNGMVDSNVSVSFSGLEIVTADDETLYSSTDSSIIYEAIRVESILIKSNDSKSIIISDDALLQRKLKVETDYLSDGTVKISGLNLFVAFRVINFDKPKITVKKLKVNAFDKNMQIDDYKFSPDFKNVMSCQCNFALSNYGVSEVNKGIDNCWNNYNFKINYTNGYSPNVSNYFWINKFEYGLNNKLVFQKIHGNFIEKIFFSMSPFYLTNFVDNKCIHFTPTSIPGTTQNDSLVAFEKHIIKFNSLDNIYANGW